MAQFVLHRPYFQKSNEKHKVRRNTYYEAYKELKRSFTNELTEIKTYYNIILTYIVDFSYTQAVYYK